jgi:hypothetical protein
MIAPIGGAQPPPPPELKSGQPSQATINAMNYLWAATYHLFNQMHVQPDFYNFQLACKAIYAFMQLYSKEAPTNQYTYQIWSELNQPLYGGSSLSQIAANYVSAVNQGNQNEIDALYSQFESTSATAQLQTVCVNVHDWWSNTGTATNTYTINTNGLTQQDLNNLENYLKIFEQDPSNIANLEKFIALVASLGPILSDPKDPFTQELADLLNTPIFPGTQTTILALCQFGNQSIPQLQAILTQLQGNHNEFYNAIANINNYEFPPSFTR